MRFFAYSLFFRRKSVEFCQKKDFWSMDEKVSFLKNPEVQIVPEIKAPDRPFYFFAKRAFDISASLAAGIFLLIPMAVVAVLIKIDSPGPVFYVQERLGKNGRPFMM